MLRKAGVTRVRCAPGCFRRKTRYSGTLVFEPFELSGPSIRWINHARPYYTNPSTTALPDDPGSLKLADSIGLDAHRASGVVQQGQPGKCEAQTLRGFLSAAHPSRNEKKMGILVLAVAALVAAVLARMAVRNLILGSALGGAVTCMGFYGADYINVGYLDPFSAISLPIVFGVGFLAGLLIAKIWPRRTD